MQKLTSRKVAALRKPGFYGDGNGLWLNVRREGSKSWSYRFMLNGRARYLGLGPIHAVSLAEARQRAREARQVILDGRDPIEEKRRAEAAAAVERLHTITFRQAALDFLATDLVEQFKNAKHRQQWHSTLALSFPVIGNLRLNEIDTAIVLQALLPIWKRTPETGSRLRGRIERVFAWAKAHKLFNGDNPASRDVLRDALPAKPKAKHQPALPYANLPAIMADLRGRDYVSARCLEFTILTACRTGDSIGMRWEEVEGDVWTVPGNRHKSGKPFRIPLMGRAAELLQTLPTANRRDGFVFVNGGGLPLSNGAMSELVKGMKLPSTTPGKIAVVHGFRSTFKDWATDCTQYPDWLSELALAHAVKNKTEAAYRRGDALDKRRRLMSEWARYCEETLGGADIVPLRA